MDDKDYEYYLRRLELANLNNYISISKEKDIYVLENISYEYPYDYYKIPAFIGKLEDGCCSGIRLKTVYIPSSVIDIGQNCFANCNELECIYIHSSSLQYIDRLKNANKAKIIYEGVVYE